MSGTVHQSVLNVSNFTGGGLGLKVRWNRNTEGGEAEIERDASFLTLWILVEGGCAGHRAQRLAKGCLPAIDVSQDTHIEIQTLQWRWRIHLTNVT